LFNLAHARRCATSETVCEMDAEAWPGDQHRDAAALITACGAQAAPVQLQHRIRRS
jgi:hypothetical protein